MPKAKALLVEALKGASDRTLERDALTQKVVDALVAAGKSKKKAKAMVAEKLELPVFAARRRRAFGCGRSSSTAARALLRGRRAAVLLLGTRPVGCRQCLAARRRRFLVAGAGGRTEPTRRRRTGCPRARRCLLGALQARVGRARCSTLALAGREPRACGTSPAPPSPSLARGDALAARGRPGC